MNNIENVLYTAKTHTVGEEKEMQKAVMRNWISCFPLRDQMEKELILNSSLLQDGQPVISEHWDWQQKNWG